jgi:hypothetical protein
VGGALRAEVAFGSTEITASAGARKDRPVQLGADVSTGIRLFDLHVEGAVRHGDETPYWEGRLDFETLELPTEIDRSDDWIAQVVAGATISIALNPEDALYVGGEYFFNDAGYDGRKLYTWLLANGQYRPLYVGRHYVGAYAMLPSPGSWDDATFTASAIGNLSDGSWLARGDVRVLALTHLSLNAYGAGHFGKHGEMRLAIDVPAIPGVVDEPISVPAPAVDLGVGATVAF